MYDEQYLLSLRKVCINRNETFLCAGVASEYRKKLFMLYTSKLHLLIVFMIHNVSVVLVKVHLLIVKMLG